MNAWMLLPPILGAAVVCQAILNWQFSESLGLATAVLINAGVFFAAAAMLWLGTRLMPDLFPDFLKPGPAGFEANATLLVPGLCGFLLVLGAPWSLQKVGPSMTFVLLVGAQIVLGVFADKWIFDLDPAWTKWLGAGLALVGAVLVVM